MLYAESSYLRTKDIYEWDMLPSGVRVKGQYTLADVQRILLDEENGLPTIGIPTTFEKDQIQRGGMLNKQYEDCLVLKNAEHPSDYFHFAFTARTTGNVTTIGIFRSGTSPLSQKSNLKDMRKASDSLFQNILGAVTKTDEQGLDAEYDYYAMVADIIKKAFGI